MTDPLQQYERHQSTYDTISTRLDTVRKSFLSADRFTQKVMLYDSIFYAVTSVQNDVSILRRAFRAYTSCDTWDDVRDVMRGVNYGNNKFNYVRSNFDDVFGDTGTNIIDRLERDHIWETVQLIADEIMGVSYIKAPFVLAMLGFKEVMCIDTNVAQMVDDDRVKARNYRSMDEYQSAVSMVENEFPGLSDRVSTFMVQWVVFDSNRENGVERHDEWFEHILPGSGFAKQTGLDEF